MYALRAALVAALVAAAGCVSAGATAALNTGLSDGPVRRVSGALQVGTFTEIAEDRLVGQLFYSRGVPPLGANSNSMGAWGARIASLSRGRLPGLYVSGAYGQHDSRTQPDATSVTGSLGVSYGWMHQGTVGRTWRGITLGLTGSRVRQETVDGNQPGYFLGFELGIVAGFDLLGPMFGRDRD